MYAPKSDEKREKKKLTFLLEENFKLLIWNFKLLIVFNQPNNRTEYLAYFDYFLYIYLMHECCTTKLIKLLQRMIHYIIMLPRHDKQI